MSGRGIIVVIISIFLSSINCFGDNDATQSDNNYQVLQAVSKMRSEGLNRNILLSERIIEDIRKRMKFATFSNQLYKGLSQVDIEGIISKDDITELHGKIDFPQAHIKWDRKKIKEENILIGKHKRGKNRYRPYYKTQPPSYYQTSPPVFFKNHQFAIIYIYTYCGWECDSEQIEVYKKNNNDEWEYFGYIFIGMS
ncbi:hypothetical protein L3049_21400 [Labilibaculum sp. DW002]|uniref:Uncharacterized protein n=1 Tax=Paralabilibaculum antarcticum TaxID=2912572 RepID=A0ABT5VYW5_9BACT|nr:hypothetical protein [Labilibaculum sp. DW002]MDE5420556.1 hypothetical protein [Labilibaculum sp. DW002]